jgi:hypothetical protein
MKYLFAAYVSYIKIAMLKSNSFFTEDKIPYVFKVVTNVHI